jgi:hypothetical protein
MESRLLVAVMGALTLVLVAPVVLAGVVVGILELVAQLPLPGKVTLGVLEQITSAAFMAAGVVAALEVLGLEGLRVTEERLLQAHCQGLLFTTRVVAEVEVKPAERQLMV